jgi:hypothetical protein
LLPLVSVIALGAILAGMLVFMLGRRAWHSVRFRRRDQFRAYWYGRLPGLLAGATPAAEELRAPEAREMLESAILHRREAAEPKDRKRLQELAERSGLLGERIRRAEKGPRWDRLESVRVLGSSAPRRLSRRSNRRSRTPGRRSPARHCAVSA